MTISRRSDCLLVYVHFRCVYFSLVSHSLSIGEWSKNLVTNQEVFLSPGGVVVVSSK